MKKITWEWRKRIMSDYFVFKWLQFSKHFDGGKHWTYEFHWKNSNAWYCNFKRHHDKTSRHRFSRTRLTFRLGTHIIVFGSVDMKKYYKDVHVLEIKHGGKITYKASPLMQDSMLTLEATPEGIGNSLEAMRKAYEHLSMYYPDDTWRN